MEVVPLSRDYHQAERLAILFLRKYRHTMLGILGG